jgi:hypothetical protein
VKDDIVVIADTQVHKGVPLDHIHALANFIIKNKPAHIVHIGDNWDFPSLSYFANPKDKEGRRLIDDLQSGEEALAIITDAIAEHNRKSKRKKYAPNLHFVMGNHEYRLNRMIDSNPHLIGLVDLNGMIENAGWSISEFLHPIWINGICFNHYMPNPQSGKAIGGGVENKLNKHPHSFVHGHQQQYQFGRRQSLDGRPHFGVCAGSFYMHDEDYRGACNTEIRGFVHMKSFTNRYDYLDYDVDFISMERLLQM